MNLLFPITVDDSEIPAIAGLRYLREYVSESEEISLAAAIDREAWDVQWRRRRQPYGGADGKGEAAPPIPTWGRALADRLFADRITDTPFDQMLVNEYEPGQGIAMHRDYEPYGRTVVSLSLL